MLFGSKWRTTVVRIGVPLLLLLLTVSTGTGCTDRGGGGETAPLEALQRELENRDTQVAGIQERLRMLERERDELKRQLAETAGERERSLEARVAELEAQAATHLNELSMARREVVTFRRLADQVQRTPQRKADAWMNAFAVVTVLLLLSVVLMWIVAARYRVIMAVLGHQVAKRAAGAPAE